MPKLTKKLSVTDGRTDGPTLIIEKLRFKKVLVLSIKKTFSSTIKL